MVNNYPKYNNQWDKERDSQNHYGHQSQPQRSPVSDTSNFYRSKNTSGITPQTNSSNQYYAASNVAPEQNHLALPAFLALDKLILQIRNSKFEFEDETGREIGSLSFHRFSKPSFGVEINTYALKDQNSQHYLHVKHTSKFFRDKFELYYPNDLLFANMKRIIFTTQHFDIQMPEQTLELRSSIIDYDKFQIFYLNGPQIADIYRDRGTLRSVFNGDYKYVISFETESPKERLAVIGGLCALELYYQKMKELKRD